MENNPITFLLTERAAYWIGYPIKENFDWNNREAPDQMKQYIGDGTTPDRLFTVTLKARYILDMVRALMDRNLQVAYDDYRSIILNAPSIPGYTSLQTQMVNKSNTVGPEQDTAKWLIDQYNTIKAWYKDKYDQAKVELVTWVNN